jgi:RHS repeat-associated protein
MKGIIFGVLLALGVCGVGVAGETTTFFHNDAAGTALMATDVNGGIVWRETYRPYGDRLIKATTSSNNTVWFTGKSHDEQIGLSYFGARYYDPMLGRFMSIDPAPMSLDNLQSFNRYAYANNNPYRYADPDGQDGVFWEFLDRFNNPFSHCVPSYQSFQAGTRQLLGNPRNDSFERDVFVNYTASDFQSVAQATAKFADYWKDGTLIMLGEVGGVGRATAATRLVGESTTVLNITAKGSRYTNLAVDLSAAKFQSNLLSNGYKIVQQTVGSNGPVTVLSNGEKTYTIYVATSTGAESAQVTNAAGEILAKIRFGIP